MEYTFKILAALLDYPSALTAEIAADAPNLIGECALLDADSRQNVLAFAQAHSHKSLLQWQQEYCEMFDVAPVTSLYLFEHVYGSSRKRGAAMSSLKDTYALHGLEISNQELPDYLPVYLDFLSRLPQQDEALSYLADIAPILKSISDNLKKSHSDYALLIEPLVGLSSLGSPHPLPQKEQADVDCPLAH